MLFFGEQGLRDFFRYRPLLPIGCRIVEILRKRRRKATNTGYSAKHSAMNNYTSLPGVISVNDKNKEIPDEMSQILL
jgi:hypothetical protein